MLQFSVDCRCFYILNICFFLHFTYTFGVAHKLKTKLWLVFGCYVWPVWFAVRVVAACLPPCWVSGVHSGSPDWIVDIAGWWPDFCCTNGSSCGICSICRTRTGDCIWTWTESRHRWTALQLHHCDQGRRGRSADYSYCNIFSRINTHEIVLPLQDFSFIWHHLPSDVAFCQITLALVFVTRTIFRE